VDGEIRRARRHRYGTVAGEREKSVFTFRAESQCRRLRNGGTKRMSCRCTPQSDCGSACKCALPFPSFSHTLSPAILASFLVRPNLKKPRVNIPVFSKGDVASFLLLWFQVLAEKADERGTKLIYVSFVNQLIRLKMH